ncbi:MAG: S-layer homology domain-containing protein [Bryobacterales bacterium]|nr:S-layer homology domain-containing protein [Bryobacterales bacterium]
MTSGSRLLYLGLAAFFSPSLLGQSLPSLLRPVEEDKPVRAAHARLSRPGMEIRRSRLVRVDQSVLLAPADGARKVDLDLFADARFEVEELRSEWTNQGATLVWVGKIAGMTRGQVVLAATGDVVSANITTDENVFYWIRPGSGGVQVLQEVQPQLGQLRDDKVLVHLDPSDAAAEPSFPSLSLKMTERAAAGTQIDVLVAYTQAARAAAGGTATIQNNIQLAVAEVNQGFLNSAVGITVNLVGSMEVNYDESVHIDQALTDLKGTTDGKMDGVHTARANLGADLVSLWINDVGSAGGVVGLGYQLNSLSSGFAPWAFSVAEQYWAAGPGYTFAHEMGHNMGADHDRANSSGGGLDSYSYGYQHTTPTTFRTIMAYSCSSVYCPHVNYWSNPNVSYSGSPTGIATTSPNSAYNAQTLNNSKSTVAAFKTAPSGCTYSLSPSSATFAATAGSGSVGVTAGSTCNWTASTATAWITVTGGAGGTGNGTVNYSVTANTGAARSGSITIAGQTFTVNQDAGAATVNYTVATSPTGLLVTVDGQAYTAPRTFSWTAGSSHTLSAATQGSGTRYSLQSWSDAGPATHTITAPAASTTYTAAFSTQYLLIAAISPSGAGSVSANPSSVDGYYNSGSTVQVSASAATGWNFSTWSGSASGSVSPLPLLMDSPKNLTANFLSATGGVTINTLPQGLKVTVDGVQYTTPWSFTWNTGTTHTMDAGSTQSGFGTRYSFSSWSDGGAQSHTITAGAGSSTFTASYATAYQLSSSVSPASGGAIVASPSSSDGFYNANTVVQLTAQAAPGFVFTNWSGDAAGSSPNASVVMNAPRAVSAAFGAQSVCIYSLSQAATSAGASGDLRQVGVQTAQGCNWSASSNASWLTVLSGASGSGNGAVRYSVASNPSSSSRTGTLTIGGVAYSVTQTAAGCSFTLSGPGNILAPGAGSYQIAVSASGACQWNALASAFWITVANPAGGSGNGSVAFSVSANNTSAPRTGSIIIGGVAMPFVQKSASLPQLFSDVLPAHPFYDYISLLKLDNVSQGCGGTNYCPEDNMSRKEMAAFIIRSLLGESFSYSPTPYFTDVPVTHSHFAYIQKLKELGITGGCTAASYCPEDPVTRGQMAAFLVRARLGITSAGTFPYPADPLFNDVGPSNIFFPYIQKMREMGITNGCTNTAYCDNDPNTRGQMSVFIIRGFF